MLIDLAIPLLTPAAYPDLTELNPKNKGKKYVMQYGRAFISQYRQSDSLDFYHGRINGRYPKAELYARGKQPVTSILVDENGQPDLSNGKVNLRQPIDMLRKILRAVDGKLKDREFAPTCTPIDATAQDEKKDYEARMRVQMMHGEWLKSMGIQANGPQGAGGEVPVDEDELALHMDVKYRHRDAMLLEMKLALALYLSDYGQQDRACRRDDTLYGSDVIHLGLRGAIRLPQRIHPGNCFFLPSETENYANLQAGAHLEKISLAALLKEIDADSDTTLDANEIEQLTTLARQNMTKGNSRGYYYDETLGGKPEMAGQLDVIRFSFKSSDEEVQTEGTNKFGNKQIREKRAGYTTDRTDVKVHRRIFTSFYEGTLIVGTEIGYGCRKAYEQLRDESNPFDCHPLYIVTSPDMLGGHSESVVEQCMVLVDMANEAFVKLRHKLNTMVGSWMEIDQDAILENTLNGEPMTPQETMRQFFLNGWIIGRKRNEDGTPAGDIITAHELPFAAEISELRNTIADCRQQIEAVTGINGSISADDPGSRQGAGVTQLAIQGAENTLEYLYHAKQARFERVCKALAVSLKQSEARAPLTGPVPDGFRSSGMTTVGTSDTLGSRVMQVKIEQKPTQVQWNSFYEASKVALTSQQINLADYAFLMSIDNLKQAFAMLGIRAKRNEMQKATSAQQNTQMISQQQMQSAQATGEEARKTNAELHAQKMELEELKGRNAYAVTELQVKGQADNGELLNFYKMQQMESAQQHAAQQAGQSQSVELAKHNAELDSQENMATQQQGHEQQMQAMQPEPAGA